LVISIETIRVNAFCARWSSFMRADDFSIGLSRAGGYSLFPENAPRAGRYEMKDY